ncbi:hypothetical protein SAMN05216238_11366 [Lentibacillus persicus]|uniref:Uncharacterized protein n=1 Tax=Lentibacillus persicus TaxID=640948 RepID=A0A1I1ZTV9_9BACI|nr:hypothetical protein SAMN05216238_11366 [Lentibacillus persicus]
MRLFVADYPEVHEGISEVHSELPEVHDELPEVHTKIPDVHKTDGLNGPSHPLFGQYLI